MRKMNSAARKLARITDKLCEVEKTLEEIPQENDDAQKVLSSIKTAREELKSAHDLCFAERERRNERLKSGFYKSFYKEVKS